MAQKSNKRTAAQRRMARKHRGGHRPAGHARPPEDTTQTELRRMTQAQLQLIWESGRQGFTLQDEDAITAQIMREHIEWHAVWDRLGTYGGKEIVVDGVSPVLHITIHGIIENQLAQNNPADVQHVLEALMRQGLDRHEAIHRIATVTTVEVTAALRDQRPYDAAGYAQRLWELVEPDTRAV